MSVAGKARAAWHSELHPRAPKGAPGGGRFVDKENRDFVHKVLEDMAGRKEITRAVAKNAKKAVDVQAQKHQLASAKPPKIKKSGRFTRGTGGKVKPVGGSVHDAPANHPDARKHAAAILYMVEQRHRRDARNHNVEARRPTEQHPSGVSRAQHKKLAQRKRREARAVEDARRAASGKEPKKRQRKPRQPKVPDREAVRRELRAKGAGEHEVHGAQVRIHQGTGGRKLINVEDRPHLTHGGAAADIVDMFKRKHGIDQPKSPVVHTDDAHLHKGTVVVERPLGGGINTTHVGRVGKTKVLIKPEHGLVQMRVREGITPGGDLPRERAAFLVSRKLGAPTPPTVTRTVPGHGRAAIQEFVSDAKTAHQHMQEKNMFNAKSVYRNLSDEGKADMRAMALLDSAIDNLDRHEGNFMITLDKRAVAIDHGLAFPEGARQYHGNRRVQTMFRDQPFTIQERKQLQSLMDEDFLNELRGTGLPSQAVVAFQTRVRRILRKGKFPDTGPRG